jgi:phosphoribosylformylglycinamidine synthase
MKYSADVIVKLKDGIRDPEGSAVDTVLKRIGLEENPEVKAGKFFSLSVTADNEAEAKSKLEKICEEVLSNPILECYNIERFE